MSLELRKFDISTITKPSVCVIIGKRGTGKTVLVKDILYNNYNNIKEKTIISPIDNYDIFPDLVINDYNPEILSNVISKCKSNDESLLILDNCLCSSSCLKDKNINSLFINSKTLKLNVIITMQYALSTTPSLRTHIDYVFIFIDIKVLNRKLLYEHYAGVFPTFEEFCQVMDQLSWQDNCLVINNITKSNKLEDRVFWYKAELH